MDDMQPVYETLKNLFEAQKKMLARIEAIEILLPVLVARDPEARGLIASVQLNLEEIDQDASKGDFYRALASLINQCEQRLPESRR